eukprot:1084736-Prymnesium_polylepis.1
MRLGKRPKGLRNGHTQMPACSQLGSASQVCSRALRPQSRHGQAEQGSNFCWRTSQLSAYA